MLSTATRALVGVMAKRNIRRLICITGIGAGDSRGHAGFFYDGLFLPLMPRKVYEYKDRQEDTIRASALDRIIVRPTALKDKPARGHICALTDLSGVHGGTVARADVRPSSLVPWLTGEKNPSRSCYLLTMRASELFCSDTAQ